MWPKNGKERKDVQDVGGIMDLRNVIVVAQPKCCKCGGNQCGIWRVCSNEERERNSANKDTMITYAEAVRKINQKEGIEGRSKMTR